MNTEFILMKLFMWINGREAILFLCEWYFSYKYINKYLVGKDSTYKDKNKKTRK